MEIRPNEIGSNGDMFTEECVKNMQSISHPISYKYKDIALAINDSEQVKEFELWNKHIDSIDEKTKEKGYFWLINDVELIQM